jgi:glycosyltransferase involved in cell wall biosynthesis
VPLLVSVMPTDLARCRGGGDRYAFEMHANLRELLPDWDARALGATTDPEHQPLPDGWTDITRNGRRKPHASDALSLARLLRLVPRDADLVLANQWWTMSTLALRLRPRRSGTLVAIDLGGGSLAAARLSRLPLPPVDLVAFKTAYEARVSPVRARRSVILRAGLDNSLFSPPVREERDIDFLLVARFLPHKGQREFIRALPPGARGRLVCPSGSYDREYEEEVRTLAEERGVVIDVDLSDAELIEAYRHARYTVQVPIAQPQQAPELLGLAMLEAMACGSVPISPSGGPSAEFGRDGETGVEYRAGDLVDLERAMTTAFTDDERRVRLAAAGVAESHHWTWSAAAEALLDEAGIA